MAKSLYEMTLEELWQLFPVLLRPYNPEYPQWYEEERGVLATALGSACRIRHIGSTSVPGLTAKPTIDILMEVPVDTVLPELDCKLLACGYSTMAFAAPPAFRQDLCKGYTVNGFAERVFHLHVVFYGDWDEPYFCEFLRRHPEAAREYEVLKSSLAAEFKHNRDAYTNAKTQFVQKYTQKARSEFPGIFR